VDGLRRERDFVGEVGVAIAFFKDYLAVLSDGHREAGHKALAGELAQVCVQGVQKQLLGSWEALCIFPGSVAGHVVTQQDEATEIKELVGDFGHAIIIWSL
jgi:hypothetical protein